MSSRWIEGRLSHFVEVLCIGQAVLGPSEIAFSVVCGGSTVAVERVSSELSSCVCARARACVCVILCSCVSVSVCVFVCFRVRERG